MTEVSKDYIISKTLEVLAEHLKNNKLFILDDHRYLFQKKVFCIINIFNNFREILFKNHPCVYMRAPWIEYIMNYRVFKHFNIGRLSKKFETTSEPISAYQIKIAVQEKLEEAGMGYVSVDYDEIYKEFYYEGDKNYVPNLRNLY